MQEFPKSKTARQLRRFPGLINFYHRFIPQAASRLHPLHQLCHSPPLSREVIWTPETDAVFLEAKKLLADATLLSQPVSSAPLRISSDARGQGVGAALEQQLCGTWRPLSFFSKHFSHAELKYSAFDKELLAAYLAVRKFQTFIEGRDCHLVTDHKPLVHAFSRRSDPWSLRQQRHLSALAEFLTRLDF